MKRKFVIFELIVLIYAFNGIFSILKAQENITVNPIEYTQPIRNPLRGFRGSEISTKNEWSTVGKYYVGWNELENNASDDVDKIINWTNKHWKGVEDNNIKIVPRVWLDYPRRKPAWPNDMTIGDFTSEQFKSRVKDLIRKLGEAWDNDPRVAFVEIGIVGKWGEQHSPHPTKEVQDIIGKAYTEAFLHKKLLRSLPDEFVKFHFGFCWDSFAHYDEIDMYEQPLLDMGDYWKTAIIEGETAYNWGEYKIQAGDNPDDTLLDTVHRYFLESFIKELHCTSLGWVSQYNASNPEIKKAAEEVQKTFGYRFVINEFTYPKSIITGKSFELSFSVTNIGVAPFYYDWPVELSLLDNKGKIVWKEIFKDVDIRKWYPGDKYNKITKQYDDKPEVNIINNSFTLNTELPKGIYTIAISILDPAGNIPSLRFAIENYFIGGRHPMGYLGVDTIPSQLKIPFEKFDNMNNDKTLHYKL